jgi:hypothetical protein
MISITAIAATTTRANQMKCQSRSAINLIPANPVNQKEICSKVDTIVAAIGQRELAVISRLALEFIHV